MQVGLHMTPARFSVHPDLQHCHHVRELYNKEVFEAGGHTWEAVSDVGARCLGVCSLLIIVEMSEDWDVGLPAGDA